MTDVELKPCPLCGRRARIVEWEECYDFTRIHIQCGGCGLELNHTQDWYMVEKRNAFGFKYLERSIPMSEDAITIWNTRVSEEYNEHQIS